MNIPQIKSVVEDVFDNNIDLSKNKILEIFDEIIDLLNSGEIRVAEKVDGNWIVNSWIKKAILLGFKHKDMRKTTFDSFDKIDLLKPDGRYRKVPGSFIRDGVYIANGAVIMPSYINIAAYIGKGTMIDINSCIGSCAQIGENCHIAAGSCIGGVLEPAVATPVIIEDGCFIGANAAVLEGVIVKQNSVIAAGLVLSASTKIIDRATGETHKGIVPEDSVLVPGSYQTENNLNINCAVMIKKINKGVRDKVSINEFLRL